MGKTLTWNPGAEGGTAPAQLRDKNPGQTRISGMPTTSLSSVDNNVDKYEHNAVTRSSVRADRSSNLAVRAVLGGNRAPKIVERTAHGKLRARTFEQSFAHYFGTAKRNDAPCGKNARREFRRWLLRVSRNRNVMNINAYVRQLKIA